MWPMLFLYVVKHPVPGVWYVGPALDQPRTVRAGGREIEAYVYALDTEETPQVVSRLAVKILVSPTQENTTDNLNDESQLLRPEHLSLPRATWDLMNRLLRRIREPAQRNIKGSFAMERTQTVWTFREVDAKAGAYYQIATCVGKPGDPIASAPDHLEVSCWYVSYEDDEGPANER